ncbi:type IX secretion system plug protein [Pedobacter gandavensis]|uniref:DUF5103 domain-containing protein n=1 Tax=Pedobacter gandavensis TaxID=2679963 RepID=A0ABR6EZZ1_9SPHI|nr:DUF5103 domain-containing protein [Pedobacter gandavensis]MBB2150832.1 DUF5103 domain-containing protein [Pedobacter gandavensis]
MIKLSGFFFVLLFSVQIAVAQDQQFVYDNKVYLPEIRTVQCYNTQKEQSLPVIALNSNELLYFSFDNLNGGSKIYSYTIEQCTSDWKPSRLSPLDYLQGMSEDRITAYKYSFGTLQQYTNYSLTLPNQQIKPKISGNYLLKVYENGNPQKPVVSQRFYVVDKQVTIGVNITASPQVNLRRTHQKVDFTISHSNPIQNPTLDLKAVVMQNGIPQTASWNKTPTFIRPGSLVYNDVNNNDFPGGNEFRKFDMRSFRYKAENVKEIIRDTINKVILFTDLNGNAAKFTNQFDENGSFFIRNSEGRDPNTDSDYARVYFTLNSAVPNTAGDAYVLGRFNNYIPNEASKLVYDAATKRFHTSIQLKQGLYDYKYVWLDKQADKTDLTVFEGSFFETENTYQVYVYYRKPGSRWEELIGFVNVNTTKR